MVASRSREGDGTLISDPDVSVVVIAFNDAARLPRAVVSALRQTHPRVEVLVVDDASTDRTGAVADRLAAAHPERVTALHLPVNSGGCSAPRNAGLAKARAPFVMFLDSDDELDPDACRVLLEAVTTEEADFAAGLCTRVYHRQHGRRGPWKPELYTRRRVVDGLASMPDLLHDTLSTNKLWRRSFLAEHGLSFPEGMHFEDLVFTAEAYVAARRFVLVPQQVYLWHVEDDPGRTSITNQRTELSNLRDRLEAHRRIDAVLGHDEDLKLAKDVKLLRHDLGLYTKDLLVGDEQWRQEALALLAPYLATLHSEAPARAGRMHELEVLGLLEGDTDLVASVVRHLKHGGKVAVPLRQDADRVYWRDVRPELDVTELGLHTRPHHDFPYFHRVVGLAAQGSVLRLDGTSLDQQGRLEGAVLSLRLSPRLRVGATSTVPVDVVREGELLRWTALLDLASFRPYGLVDDLYRVVVVATREGESSVEPLTLDPGPELPDLPVRPRLSRLVATHARPYVSGHGNLELRLVALTPASRAVRRALGTERVEGAVRRLRYRLQARRAGRAA
jgi:CDP-glycerol glycerophosphotransferase